MVLRRSPEKKEEKERVRNSLLRAALRLSASFGFPSLSLREVSREAGIAPTSFYRHFEDMEQLGLALVNEHAGPLLRELTASATHGNGEALATGQRFARALFHAVGQDPELVRFLVSERVGGVASVRTALAEHMQSLVGELDAVVKSSGVALRPACSSRDGIEAMMAIALEGAFRALESPVEHRDAALNRTLRQLETLLSCAGQARSEPCA